MKDKSEIYKTFGKRLKAIRKELKMTQIDFSKHLSIDRSLYTKYETGASMPPGYKLYEMAKNLGVSTDFLLGLNDNDN